MPTRSIRFHPKKRHLTKFHPVFLLVPLSFFSPRRVCYPKFEKQTKTTTRRSCVISIGKTPRLRSGEKFDAVRQQVWRGNFERTNSELTGHLATFEFQGRRYASKTCDEVSFEVHVRFLSTARHRTATKPLTRLLSSN